MPCLTRQHDFRTTNICLEVQYTLIQFQELQFFELEGPALQGTMTPAPAAFARKLKMI
jgi:hypothetical protein